MGSLTLVGTIHRDPNGLPKLMEILERESPEIIMRNHGHTVHVGGWEHLLDDPPGKILYGLLKDLGPRRVLSL